MIIEVLVHFRSNRKKVIDEKVFAFSLKVIYRIFRVQNIVQGNAESLIPSSMKSFLGSLYDILDLNVLSLEIYWWVEMEVRMTVRSIIYAQNCMRSITEISCVRIVFIYCVLNGLKGEKIRFLIFDGSKCVLIELHCFKVSKVDSFRKIKLKCYYVSFESLIDHEILLFEVLCRCQVWGVLVLLFILCVLTPNLVLTTFL